MKTFHFHLIIFLTKPLVRLSFIYFYFPFCNLLLGLDISVINFFLGSEDVNSASSADSNSLLEPGPFHHIPNVEPTLALSIIFLMSRISIMVMEESLCLFSINFVSSNRRRNWNFLHGYNF